MIWTIQKEKEDIPLTPPVYMYVWCEIVNFHCYAEIKTPKLNARDAHVDKICVRDKEPALLV